MIDIENSKKVFSDYVSNFNPNDGKIKLKIEHILRVANMSKLIAKNLNLTEEQIQLAELIGIFHDIGRFKQVELYNTFSDKVSGLNHAEFSIKILYEDNLIKNFNIDDKYTHIIKAAVLNHNKNKIENNLTEEELLFCKIIRDADKLDIYYTICEYDFESIFWYSDFNFTKINDIIMNQFLTEHYVDYSHINSNTDQLSIFYAYAYDLYFDFSIQYLRQNKYLDKFTNRIFEHLKNQEVEEQVTKLLEVTNTYLSNFNN